MSTQTTIIGTVVTIKKSQYRVYKIERLENIARHLERRGFDGETYHAVKLLKNGEAGTTAALLMRSRESGLFTVRASLSPT